MLCFDTYAGLVEESGIHPFEHLVRGSETQVILHQSLEPCTEHLFLFFHGTRCRWERISLFALRGAVWCGVLARVG